MSNLPPKKSKQASNRNWTPVTYHDSQNDTDNAMTYSVLGYDLSLSDMAESARAMLEDDMAAEGDPTACDCNVALPYEGDYVCGTCHTEVELDSVREVWVTFETGVVKVELVPSFGGQKIFS